MDSILEELCKIKYLVGRYKSNPNICLYEGAKNTLVFSTIGYTDNHKGILEIDGKDIQIISGNCFKIEHKGMEIFLSPSSPDSGEWTAGLLGISMFDDATVEYMLRLMIPEF